MIRIRPEMQADHRRVRSIYLEAYPTPAEADLVSHLRGEGGQLVSLVAAQLDISIDPASRRGYVRASTAGLEREKDVVGHILFTRVDVEGCPDAFVMGLAPMAVAEDMRGQGVGNDLILSGKKHCANLGAGALVVLGHVDYYPRFGFEPASRRKLSCEYDVPDEAFMAMELRPGYLDGVSGLVRYNEAFSKV